MSVARRARRILVLGGSGFVGRGLVRALAGLGYSVRVPTRNRARSRQLLVIPEAELVQSNVHDPADLRALVHGSHCVVNLVGILNERGHDGSGFVTAHVALAEKLVAACQAAGVTRVLQVSALKADAERAPSHYLRTKGRAEEVIIASGLEATVFRPSVIFGPEDSFINRFAGLLRISPMLPLACPNARFAPVYVGDVVAACVAAVRSRLPGTYELCGPDIYSLEDIVRMIRSHLRLRRLIVPLPPFLSQVTASVGEYLPGKPFSRDNLASLGVASVCVGDDLRSLGVSPQSLAMRLGECLGETGRRRRLNGLRRRTHR